MKVPSCRQVTACPACGALGSQVIGESAGPFEAIVAGRLFRQPAFEVRFCTGCGLYFKSHTLSLADLNEYYSHLPCDTFDYSVPLPTDLLLYAMLDRLPAGSRVLDFGCNTGRTLSPYAMLHECFGVEINSGAAAVARKRGIEIATEDKVASGQLGSFDAIVAADVYEHLPNPIEVLLRLAGLLKPGGQLAIVTGNADAIRTRDRIGEFWYFQLPGHLHMMSEQHGHWLAHRIAASLTQLHRCCHYTVPLAQRVKQRLQSFAYHQFRRAPESATSAVLRQTPAFRRAEAWKAAPALTFTADHFVAVFEKQLSGQVA